MQLGATFSHRFLTSLGYNPNEAIKDFKSLRFKWIRLGCYWDEIQPKKDKFDFSKLDPLIKFCQKNKISVVLTVGMKAPRWPEYYTPSWATSPDVFLFTKKCIMHYKTYSCIKVWQVENEPFDHSGPNWRKFDTSFIEKECELVRKLDPTRKILLNVWGNELTKRKVYKKALMFADIIGFDFYLRHPIPFLNWFKRYIGPLDSVSQIKSIMGEVEDNGKESWIVELQTEPWEPGEIITKKQNPPSFLPEHFRTNLDYAKRLVPAVTLLWGFEWWYHKKMQGDNRYWEEARKIT